MKLREAGVPSKGCQIGDARESAAYCDMSCVHIHDVYMVCGVAASGMLGNIKSLA